MRRLDEVEARFGRCNPGTPDINWLVARIRRLEEALEAAKITAVAGPGGGFYVSPSAYEQNVAIDAALKENP
mgnify:CR=1 FL=1